MDVDIERIFRQSHVAVFTTKSPLAALEILEARQIDVIVADIDMPDMNGLELIHRVKAQYPRTLRLLLTGNASLERALHAINEGEVLRFLTKPFEPRYFRATLEGLAARVERGRGDEGAERRKARQTELRQWLDSRYPDLLRVLHADQGEVLLDVARLTKVVEKAGSMVLGSLLRGEA